MSKVVADYKLPDKSDNRLPYGLFTLRLQNNSSPRHLLLLIQVSHCLQGYLVIFWSDMNRTVVSSSPPLEILPLEYMAVLESN